jgi:hypothetical protein
MDDIHVKDENYELKHFTILQNILSRIGLSAYERSVYWALKECSGERGSCTKSYKNLAIAAGMGESSLKKTIKSLSEPNKVIKKPLILVKKRNTESGDSDTNEIVLVDIWKENLEVFKEKNGGSPRNPPKSPHNLGGSPRDSGVGRHATGGGSPRDYKQEPINNNQEQQQRKDVAVAFFQCLIDDERLTDKDRKSLMQFPEDRIKLALDYSRVVKTKTKLIALLIWHCKEETPPEIPKRKITSEEKIKKNHSKAFEMASKVKSSQNFKFEMLSKKCEIIALTAQKMPVVLNYDSDPEDFEKKLTDELKYAKLI